MPRPVSRILRSLVAAVALLAACGEPAWREINTPEGGFRVLMQDAPHVEKNQLETPIGKLSAEWYSLETKDAAFGVGYADFPAEVVSRAEPRRLFATVRESWLKRIHGKLQGDGTDIKLENKYPGMEFIAYGKLNDRDAYLRGRFYLVDNRLFQLIVFGNKDKMPVSDINRFLGSFKTAPRYETSGVEIAVEKDPTERAAKGKDTKR